MTSPPRKNPVQITIGLCPWPAPPTHAFASLRYHKVYHGPGKVFACQQPYQMIQHAYNCPNSVLFRSPSCCFYGEKDFQRRRVAFWVTSRSTNAFLRRIHDVKTRGLFHPLSNTRHQPR